MQVDILMLLKSFYFVLMDHDVFIQFVQRILLVLALVEDELELWDN